MKYSYRQLILAAIWLLTTPLQAQTATELHRYDETNSALEGHTTQILQDRNGLLWISTWNGIYRFDGYEFCRIKPNPDDDCSMTSDRIRDIWLAKNGDIYVRNDETLFYFDINTYRFRNLRDQAELEEAELQRDNQPTRGRFVDERLIYIDPQGLEWHFHKDALYCISRVESPEIPLHMEKPAMVRCLTMDSKRRVWVPTKEDASVRLMMADGTLLGYLRPDGTLSATYCSFGHPIYTITESSDGHIWLGSKPDGLFRLTDLSDGQASATRASAQHFAVEPIESLAETSVYGIAEDKRGRLWIATLGDGIACIETPSAPQPVVVHPLPGFPKDKCQRVRHIHISPQGTLLAATTEGLLTARLEEHAADMKFHLHLKDPRNVASLSCNAVMDIVETTDNRVFVATETGGVCEIISDDLQQDTLQFRRYDVASGALPTDMTIGMTLAPDNHLIITSTTRVINLDLNSNTFESLGHHFFHNVYHFSEARPLLLPNGNWLFGTLDGAFFLHANDAHHSNYQPPLLLTSVTYANDRQQLAVASLDTLMLEPSVRSLTLQFAALDYVDPLVINYQYRLGTDSVGRWVNLGNAHSITLPNLSPGTYQLAIRSTNAEGVWTNNTRTLTIIAKPAFWETIWAKMLFLILGLAIVGSMVYTYLYIKRINRRQHETLRKYLALLEENEKATDETTGDDRPAEADATDAFPTGTPPLEDDPFMQRVLDFVEQNLGNSDADVGQMAEACAVSRSVLQRKVKSMMGVTPADFLREARLKRAGQMLRSTELTVSEVAFRCGFSDPKYFSRCFKQSTGLSPTEYKNR